MNCALSEVSLVGSLLDLISLKDKRIQVPYIERVERIQVAVQEPAASLQTQKKKKYVLADLPNGSEDRFRTRFIPTVIWFIGFYKNPWSAIDDKLVKVLQIIWKAVYGDAVKYEITVGDAVCYLVRSSCLLPNWC